jgi:hypothetical protein
MVKSNYNLTSQDVGKIVSASGTINRVFIANIKASLIYITILKNRILKRQAFTIKTLPKKLDIWAMEYSY